MKFLPMEFTRGIVCAVLFTLIAGQINAQLDENYQPRQTHDQLSRELIYSLELQFQAEAENMPDDRQVRQINSDRRIAFMEKIVGRAFIKDDSLESYPGSVLSRLVERNKLSSSLKRVLVLSSPHVNAVCYGQGIYAVTAGLLARIENEDQLAFILAHELAHDELGHIRTRVVQEADLNMQQRARRHAFKIISGKDDLNEIESFRELLYNYSRHSRRNEFSADSMAVVLLHNAGYHNARSTSILNILEAPQSPKYPIGPELFFPLHSPDYPFHDYCLNDRLSVYSKKGEGSFLYVADSVETHPSIKQRKNALTPYATTMSHTADYMPSPYVNAVSDIAAFETVESAFNQKEYDLALYHALQLYIRYPKNIYLISRIGKILIDVREAKRSNAIDTLVPKYTTNHSDEVKVINSLLYNLTEHEVGEIAFHMLSRAEFFNPNEKNHYYLLWEISSSTGRKEVATKTARQYKVRFGSNISTFRYH